MPSEWLSQPPQWKDYKELLLADKHSNPPPQVSVNRLVEKSDEFPLPFPVKTVRCRHLRDFVSEAELETNINSTYPVIHEHGLLLCAMFLSYQKDHGANSIYKDMTLLGFIDRLLGKRPASFWGRFDTYLLLNGTRASGGWKEVGTKSEHPPLLLRDYLSYDEIKCSALLSVSSHTYFVNDGSRTNKGKFDQRDGSVERKGVIVGLIGARLKKKYEMEYRELVKSKEQNTQAKGYGLSSRSAPSLQSKFLEFFGDTNCLYVDDVDRMKADPERYIVLEDGVYFDRLMFERRIALSIDTLLIEANDRAKREGKKAYVHVVGLGLGVWKIYKGQDRMFMDTFAKRLDALKDVLTDISDVHFAYIRHNAAGQHKDGDVVNGVAIHIGNRNPHERLEGEDEGKLLVVSYAWDGNALPGNEFWMGKENLAASGDPAAAASSQVSELHNYHINERVRASNLRIATLGDGVVSFEEYQRMHKDD